ncbi:MAG: hypothetical protein ABI741_11440 [Ferruginibacter sp.]
MCFFILPGRSNKFVHPRPALVTAITTAQLWKNGVATVLSANGSNGIAQGVYVKSGDVYVSEAGFMNGPVRLWKNNIPTLLTTGSNFNSVSSVIVK